MRNLILSLIITTALFPSDTVRPSFNKFKSVVLPGLGEYSMGHEKKARSFFIREVGLWIVCLGSKKLANWYEDDYTAFAELHANVDMSGKEYLYIVNIGHYDSFDKYNEIKLRQRQIDDVYQEGENLEWEWDSKQNRYRYNNMRLQSITYQKAFNFAIAGLLIHRAISFFDVLLLERKKLGVQLTPQISPHNNSFKLHFSIDL